MELQPISRVEAAPAQALSHALLALNNTHVPELSWLQPRRLEFLIEHAFTARRIGHLDAFIVAFDQDAPYDSPNFLWFRDRYARFVYVDRIVVAPWARGRGHARLLYRDLFDQATKAGHEQVVCEVNARPPNPASQAFHAALGFAEVGRASIRDGNKTVRYLRRPLCQRVAHYRVTMTSHPEVVAL
jgi:uncharacterized protein